MSRIAACARIIFAQARKFHTCSLSRIFADVHAAGKNNYNRFCACRRKTLRGCLGKAFYAKKRRPVGRRFFELFYRAFFAVSTRTANASGSEMASSERALRFISMPAFFRPFMKRE